MQPSLEDVFGIKGASTGSGLSRVFPQEDANLHLTGDLHAISAAHNLCAAYMDNSIFKGNPLDIDITSITWKRVISTNDRSLRSVNIGLGSKTDGVPRKTGFDITPSSELMGILALAHDLKDLRERIGKIVIGFTKKGKPVTAEDIKAAGAMAVLLKDALKPNLLQTTEHTACLMHTSSYGNISLGVGSIVADKIALGLERPWEPTGHIGIEAHLDRAADCLAWRDRGDLRRSAESCGAAEPVVERHRRIGGSHHDGDKQGARPGDEGILAGLRWVIPPAHSVS